MQKRMQTGQSAGKGMTRDEPLTSVLHAFCDAEEEPAAPQLDDRAFQQILPVLQFATCTVSLSYCIPPVNL